MTRPFQESRRRLLAGGTGAVMAAASGLASAGRGNGQHASGKKRVTLGFIPLTDCAPLVIAAERGFFAAEGLDVKLSREPFCWTA